MKKKYITPIFITVEFNPKDIITVSSIKTANQQSKINVFDKTYFLNS